MARPVKKGLDFFPLDVAVDDNLELLEAECGLEGFAIIIKLWQKIYATGYFIDWEEDNALLFARKINSDLTTVNKVVNVGLNRGLFNKNLFNSYKILTSKGIQSRYTKICSDANRKDYSIFDDYNLINPELTTVKSEETLVKSESSTQSKVNKNKVDYNNVKKEEYTLLETAIEEFKKHRKMLKKPMTDLAVTKLKNKLDTFTDDDDIKIQILEQSILNGWQGVFELKAQNKTKPKSNFNDEFKENLENGPLRDFLERDD